MSWIRRAGRWLAEQWDSHNSVVNSVCVALALILGMIALAQWGELRRRQMPADWGSVPDWVAAVGTLAAFAALAFTVAEWRSSRADQARLIVAQPARDDSNPSTQWFPSDDIVVKNHSEKPVFDLEIDDLGRGENDRLILENLGPQVQSPAKHAIFRPQQTTGPLTVVGKLDGATEASSPTALRYVAYTFTDASGRRWRRVGTGQPTRVYA